MRQWIGFFLRIIGAVLFWFPRKFVRVLGIWIGFLWFDVLRIRRDIVIGNLTIAFPEMSELEKIEIGRASVYELGYQASEFLTLPFLNQKWIEKNIVIEGFHHLEAAMSEQKGVYLLGMHMGFGDLVASVLSMKGVKVNLITKVFKNRLFNDIWFSIRGSQGVRYINAHADDNAFQILKAIKRKETVAFVLDQYMGPPFGIETSFFGKKTGTAYGLALFYLKTGSPIVPVYAYESESGQMHLCIEPALQVTQMIGDDREKNILVLTQAFNDTIESAVRKHPKAWMWVHRRWKNFGRE